MVKKRSVLEKWFFAQNMFFHFVLILIHMDAFELFCSYYYIIGLFGLKGCFFYPPCLFCYINSFINRVSPHVS